MSFTIRRAGLADADAIAAAHIDSIQSIGPKYYDDAVVNDWNGGLTAALYANAMNRGEVFFIAVADDDTEVLGFSSHRIDGADHGTAVYVRGRTARRGIGSALLREAEASAIAAGAKTIEIDASLAAVGFYKANRFEEVGRGEHRLRSGRTMACVFMRKRIGRPEQAPDGSG